MKASLIISFYNNISALKLILAALSKQSEKQFEVIIADDGSKEEVKNEITLILKNYPFKINHLWHEDKGFRKNRILNQAIQAAQSPYLIFIDGDCIPHRHFIKDHLEFSQPQRVVVGRRVNLSKKMSDLLDESKIQSGLLNRWFLQLFIDRLFGKSKTIEKGIYIRYRWFIKHFASIKKGILGCNFSLHKSAMLAINGFDMRYELPCVGEDTDPCFRLKLLNFEIYSPKFRLIQYHLYHDKQSRAGEEINYKILEETKRINQAKTSYGITEL